MTTNRAFSCTHWPDQENITFFSHVSTLQIYCVNSYPPLIVAEYRRNQPSNLSKDQVRDYLSLQPILATGKSIQGYHLAIYTGINDFGSHKDQ